MSKDTGGPAFPRHQGQATMQTEGMTLRDYFAAKAMQSMVDENFRSRRDEDGNGSCPFSDEEISEFSYSLADAMIAERNRES